METSKNKLAMILIVLIIIVAAVGGGIALSRANSSETASEQTSNKEVENKTDMETLKASEYTNDAFEKVQLGDSKAEVEKNMGKLTSVEIESEEDVYTVTDDKTAYYFYFDGDSLANVSVFLT